MTRTTAPDTRRAFLVRTRPLPTFRVRSASGEPAHLVVVQHDLSMTCQCTAASFGAPDCAHRRIVARSVRRRVRVDLSDLPRDVAASNTLFLLQGGRA